MEKIYNNLKKGVVAPCYLLYGEEEYLIKEALGKILDMIIPEADRDFGLFYLEGENTDMDSLIDNVLTPSLFGNRKVIVVRDTNIFTSKEDLIKLIDKIRTNIDENQIKAARYFLTFLKIVGFTLEDLQGSGWQKITDDDWSEMVKGDSGEDRQKWLPRILEICQASGLTDASVSDKTEKLEEIIKEGMPAGNCLIFTAESVDKRKKIYKTIAERGVVQEFVRVKKETARREILQKEAQNLLDSCGKKMSPAAWMALGRKTGFDFRRSMSELEKLISFVGDRALIDKDDIEEAVGRTKEDDIFALTNSLSEKNQLAALEALKHLLDQGEHHLAILTMVSREIRLLLQARVLVDSGKLPKFNQSMEYGWFQNILYPAFNELNPSGVKREGLIFSQHPFSVYNAMRNCVRFTTVRLIALMEELLNLERSLKTSGTTHPQLLLENFLIKSCL
ncbi:MAG TPA: DNA polymerase III subunit delta [Smithella sp.]|nr:DNA polymerase III subunit delta [Smithella sp.]HQP24932.1 DNA polymerase III subunit delta [Smithellaceae bacterium]HNY51603.1 DNA polymerase III subunit delta [Smithella sp.]HOG91046.1 DNA polymerase III subunit delta [Smithella sp.]HOU51632.1 DNA polymerase III subunit delta [Smithella sp.]